MATPTVFGLVGNFHESEPVLILGPFETRMEAEERRQKISDKDGWRILPMWRDDIEESSS